jgi:hypothetical protein
MKAKGRLRRKVSKVNRAQNRSWRRREDQEKKSKEKGKGRGIFARLLFACSGRAQVFLRSSRRRRENKKLDVNNREVFREEVYKFLLRFCNRQSNIPELTERKRWQRARRDWVERRKAVCASFGLRESCVHECRLQ